MLQSTLFGKTTKDAPKDASALSHKLLSQAGFIARTAAGIYSFLPLGWRVLKKIDHIIRDEFEKRGIQDLLMPVIHPASLWEETGRAETMADILIRFESKRGQDLIIAPTHEETVSDLARRYINSYKDLPVIVNQNQTKFRDEMRVQGGILRTREFIMQDAYSFDIDKEGLQKSYDLMKEAYVAIFERMGIDTIAVAADSGAMGGSGSEEFIVLAEVGEDRILICDSCDYKANQEFADHLKIKPGDNCPECKKGQLSQKNGIEVGHIFQLGTKYSDSMGISVPDESGKSQQLEMGCYGIGMTRVMAATVEQKNDDNGIIWPKNIAPFQVHLIGLNLDQDKNVGDKAIKLYEDLRAAGIEVLFDDRNISPGKKFADSDLIGIPIRLTISTRSLENGGIELKMRNEEKAGIVAEKELLSGIKSKL